MSLHSHAKEELTRAGFFSKDSDYGGVMGKAVLELVEAFAKQGHSGFSASVCLSLFEKLARFQTLTPLTSDPEEWIDRTAMSAGPLWQNRRDSHFFSNDGGKTWWSVERNEN